jgi:hypothetical protein
MTSTRDDAPHARVALRLTGKGFQPEDVTAMTGVTPTETWRLGEFIGRSQLRRKNDGWAYGLSERKEFDMEILLLELLEELEPYKVRILDAVRAFELDVEISFCISFQEATPALVFDIETLQRLVDLRAALDIDLYAWGE